MYVNIVDAKSYLITLNFIYIKYMIIISSLNPCIKQILFNMTYPKVTHKNVMYSNFA